MFDVLQHIAAYGKINRSIFDGPFVRLREQLEGVQCWVAFSVWINIDAGDMSSAAFEVAQCVSPWRTGVIKEGATSTADVEHMRLGRQQGIDSCVERDVTVAPAVPAVGEFRIGTQWSCSCHCHD